MLLRSRWILCMVTVGVMLCLSLNAMAQVSVIPTITFGGGLYHYDYSITDGGPDDVFLIDIGVAPDPAAVQNLVTPVGFTSAFDSGLGVVSFLEDSAFFGPSPISGFAFDSPYKPQPTTFQATAVDANGGLVITSGSTISASVPEPGVIGLATGLFGFCGLIIKRRLR